MSPLVLRSSLALSFRCISTTLASSLPPAPCHPLALIRSWSFVPQPGEINMLVLLVEWCSRYTVGRAWKLACRTFRRFYKVFALHVLASGEWGKRKREKERVRRWKDLPSSGWNILLYFQTRFRSLSSERSSTTRGNLRFIFEWTNFCVAAKFRLSPFDRVSLSGLNAPHLYNGEFASMLINLEAIPSTTSKERKYLRDSKHFTNSILVLI